MRYVKYIGTSPARVIEAKDWRSVGIAADTVVWSALNGFAVPLESFSDDQIRKAIGNDPELVITGDDEDFTPQPQNRDMTPSQVTQVTEAPVDVLDMVGGAPSDAPTGSGASNVAPGTSPTTVTTGGGSGHDES